MKEHRFGSGSMQIQFAHANANPPLCYTQMVDKLVDEGATVYLPVQRPLWPDSDPLALRSWTTLSDDLISHMDELGRKNVIGVGHSMGGVATWLAAIRRPDLFSQLILLEPVILPEPMMKINSLMPWSIKKKVVPIVKIALQRRDKWSSVEELESHLGAKKVFQRWDRGCWEDFKKHGVRPTISGGMTLTYPKLWEARIYSTAPNLWKMMSHSTPPLTMIRGQFTDVITSKNWDRVATQMPQASLMEMDGVGHLLPFEKPTEVADLILKLIDTDQS